LAKNLDRRRRTGQKFEFLHGEFVHVAGIPIAFATEKDRIAANIDHCWITVGTGTGEPIRIVLSTYSRQNAAAGFDPRVRVGVVASVYGEFPAPGVTKCAGLDYGKIEATELVAYKEYERPKLEALLAEKTNRAAFVEGWGELYLRHHLGIHQVHSRRASCSVLQDYTGRDGAVRFYFGDNGTAEMLLFKFCGQA